MTAIEQRLRQAASDLDTAFAVTDPPRLTRLPDRRPLGRPKMVAGGLALAICIAIAILVLPLGGSYDSGLRTVASSAATQPQNPGSVTVTTGGATPQGTLRITQFRTACCYTEGSVTFLSVAGPNGAVVTDGAFRPLEDRQVLYAASLPAGRYDVISYQRPCNGNCDQLSAPTDQCSASFDIVPRQTAAVVIRTAPSKPCTMQIDDTVTSQLPDEIALVPPMTDCGIDTLPAGFGRHPQRECFVAAYDARRAAQVITYNRGPDTGDGNDQQIVRVDTSNLITVYRRILGPGQTTSPWTKQTCTGLTADTGGAVYILTGCTAFSPLT